MVFQSILNNQYNKIETEQSVEKPVFFYDLNLDQIIEAILFGKKEYNLEPFFHHVLDNLDVITYRHEVMRDIENQRLYDAIGVFSLSMRRMREDIKKTDALYYEAQKQGGYLDIMKGYCDSISAFACELETIEVKSKGFLLFKEFLEKYIHSEEFMKLGCETEKLKKELSTVEYCIFIKGKGIKVRKFNDEDDYGKQVEEIFLKFRQGEAKDYRCKFVPQTSMKHMEAKILDQVVRLFPTMFENLEKFYKENLEFQNPEIQQFEREIQFYIAYYDFMEMIKKKGLKFTYPVLSLTSKEIEICDGFDLSLANKFVDRDTLVVCNDFIMKDRERILVVSGANQGGKTTFARMFGQIHYLACLGLPIPGSRGKLHVYDNIFTHFENKESETGLNGKLQDDLIRVYDILEQATSHSIIIMNETFSSTTLRDAAFLGKKVIDKIIEKDLLCLYVTFIDELSALNDRTVSMVSTVLPDNPAVRTYKVIRKPADGHSYAVSVAEKYHLTYKSLKERMKI